MPKSAQLGRPPGRSETEQTLSTTLVMDEEQAPGGQTAAERSQQGWEATTSSDLQQSGYAGAQTRTDAEHVTGIMESEMRGEGKSGHCINIA